MKDATFKVSDMSCGHCEAAVEGSLGEFSGVKRSNADLDKGIVGYATMRTGSRSTSSRTPFKSSATL